ncbi:hypothetical protein [Streptomyces sp. NPDC020965]|uniref:hypothetical protein n=1 Tax=Streptomyces sp. NPDC020965 TaxID=3365105 RepID=UPI0037ACE585
MGDGVGEGPGDRAKHTAGDGGAGGVFDVATGDGPPDSQPAGADDRAAQVRTAFDGLSQIRRLTGTAPATWERLRPVRAVALALEAGGVPPSAVDAEGGRVATGYRVRGADRAGVVWVEWLGPAGSGAAREEEVRLRECVTVLAAAGWEALLYRGPRRRRFLEVEPGA